MKKTLGLIILMVLMASSAFAFSGYVDITNRTGYTIYYVYVSHTDDSGWGSDELGSSVIMNGDTFRVNVSKAPSSIFDIKIEDEDGDTYTFWGVDIARENITVTLADLDTGGGSGGGNFNGYVDITNRTGYTIYYVYISHEDASSWGSDWLGSSVLMNGDSQRFNLNNYPSSVFDIKLEDEDGDTYTFWDVDVAYRDLTVTLDDLD